LDIFRVKKMNRKIFLIRHSETIYNTKGIYLGWSETPISDKGQIQAHNLKKHLGCGNIKTVYSSPLKRALQTAEIFCGDKQIRLADNLKDIRISASYEGKYINMLRDKHTEYEKAHQDVNFKLKDGESIKQVNTRVLTWFKRAKKITRGNFLIVTHEIIINLIIQNSLGIPVDSKEALQIIRNLRIRHDRLNIIEESKRYGHYLSINSL